NAATQVTRTVNVVDVTPPVVTILGAHPVTIVQNAVYADAGITATDDTAVTVNLTSYARTLPTFLGPIIGNVDTATLGTYEVRYFVQDAAVNKAFPGGTEPVRTVNVVAAADVTLPVITLNGAPTVTVAQGSPFADAQGVPFASAGATATDNVDGNITANIVVGGTYTNTGTISAFTITYDVNDGAGNAATTVIRTVNVTDQTPPVIALNGTSPMTVALGDTFTDPGTTVTDNVDTGLTATATGTVNAAALGTYTLTYNNVIDAAGNSATPVTRTVNVTDQTPPVIALKGASLITVTLGGTFTDPGTTVTDNVDAGLTAMVTGAVNTTVAGAYALTYNVSDTANNAAIAVTRTINVVAPASTPPVMTAPADILISAADFNGVPATDQAIMDFLNGATATDVASGTRTVTNDAPAIFPVGSTQVTFTSSDASGNSTTITATVTVSGTSLGATVAPANGAADDDGDGITNAQEYIIGSDPNSTDTDGDGIPDSVEVGSSTKPTDSDGDGVFDINELPETSDDPSKVSGVASSNRGATFTIDGNGQNLSGITVDDLDGSASGTAIGDLGLLSYRVATDVGGTATVTITSDVALPIPLELFKVDANGVYTAIDAANYTVIGNTVELTVVDGGVLDQDGEVNGVVVDPLAFAQGEVEAPTEPETPAAPDTPATDTPEATPSSGSSGGCLVPTSTGQSMWLLPITGLMLLGIAAIRRKEKE
ncbi:MAG: DUF5011 domain-containing protein, partial [Mariprofundaceae bacterium]